jgi:mono/diheme cytochrome c family protein
MLRRLTLLTPLLLVATWSAVARDWPTKIPSEAERGRELYDRHCLGCHGPKAAGDGLMAAALRAKVPDFQQGFGDRPHEDLVRIVQHGKGAMPAYESAFSKDDTEKLVRYMDGLGRAPEKPQDDKGKPADDDEADADVGG